MTQQRKPQGWSRREVLCGAAATSAALAFPSIILPRRAYANITAAPVRDIVMGARGATIYLEMEHGPFPHRGSSYSDNTTIVYVPYHFRLRDDRIDTVMHFHGHRTTAEQAMRDHELREQLLDSLQNAILVMPQGPVRAADSSGGKLDQENGMLRFLTEVRHSLQQREVRDAISQHVTITNSARIGFLCLSGHSGGYRVIARCLERGGFNVNEVYLMDALYGELSTFQTWVEERRHEEHHDLRHKIVSFYQSDQTVRRNNITMVSNFERANIPLVHETVGSPITRGQFTRYRSVFIECASNHQAIAWAQNNLRDCLFSSCLRRHIEADWFDDTERPRSIDSRR